MSCTREQERCARDRRTAETLGDIATEILGARDLVWAGWMAAQHLGGTEESNALAELLDAVAHRLAAIQHRRSPARSRTLSAVVPHPRAVELVARRQLRKKVEAAVDRLLAILDDLDGDPEAEPWLGAPEAIVITPRWSRGSTDDREQDVGDEPEIEDEHADQADHEPSLGAPENQHDQRQWPAGGRHDVEETEHA